MTESVSDLIPTTITASLLAVITFFSTNQLNEAKRFWAYFYAYQLLFHTITELANFMTIILSRYEMVCILLSLMLAMSNAVLSNLYVQDQFLPDTVVFVSNISIFKFTINMLLISILGFDRCPHNQTSRTLYLFELLDEGQFWQESAYIWAQLLSFKVMSLFAIMVINKQSCFNCLYNFKIIRKQKSNEI